MKGDIDVKEGPLKNRFQRSISLESCGFIEQIDPGECNHRLYVRNNLHARPRISGTHQIAVKAEAFPVHLEK
jgi:hypothetical protein